MSIKHLLPDNFEDTVKNAALPVIVDFWASWCNPCRMIAPVLEELADELDGRAEVCKVDVDEAGDIAAGMGVMSVPTIMVLVGGKEKERVVGYRSKDELMAIVGKYV
ncbi:MAG: thioredoxin [Oscillospiraceae bacterium]|nr:thioredoxin [Oscillospiraceae bacterium]